MGEFDGRAAGRAAGEHIGEVTRKVTAFVNDEPDRLMHLATQTGFITPGDQRYTRFLTDQQIDTFNRNMADNADLVRAHAEQYRRDQEESRALAGDAHVKAYLDTAGLADPQGFEAMTMIGDKPAQEAFNKNRQAIWAGGARAGFAGFGKRHGWSPEEIADRQAAIDRRFGYVAPAPAPGPANGGGPVGFNGVDPGPSAPMQGPPAPVQRTASMFGGLTPDELSAADSVQRTGRMQMAGLYSQGHDAISSLFSGRIPGTSAPSGPQPAGPPVTKQPGQPGAATPQDRAAWLRMLAGE